VVTHPITERRLTAVEQSLVDHVTRGDLLDLAADDKTVDEAAMRSSEGARTVRAKVIRDILRGRLTSDPDPRGVRIRGARISGRLDLENLATNIALRLTNCFLEEGVLAGDAHLPLLDLTGCRLEHPTEPPLDAGRLTATAGLYFAHAVIAGHCERGTVRLVGARIGALDCTGATLTNDAGSALAADGLQLDQDLFLCGRFSAAGAGRLGAVRLLGAHIGGQLVCDGAQLSNGSGPALHADRAEVDQGVLLRGEFTATGGGSLGAVRLLAARVGGLDRTGATLTNTTGPALAADGLQVHQDLLLRGKFTASGAGDLGTVRLLGAQVGGQLDCSGATMGNKTGPALNADSLRVDQNMFLRDEFCATGAGDLGAVRLFAAHIGGDLESDWATLANDSGPALNANGLRVDQGLFLGGGFSATGVGELGAIRLIGARIGGQLNCDGAELTNPEGLAVNLERASVAGSVFMRPVLLRGGLDLTNCRVGNWSDEKRAWPDELRLEGFIYDSINARDATVKDRLQSWLPRRGYLPQPYEQLATAYRREGHERNARMVAIGKQRVRRAQATGWAHWPSWVWSAMLRWTIGYDYRPALAVIPMLVLGTAGSVLFHFASAHPRLLHPAKTGSEQPGFNSFRYTLDLLLPVANFHQRDSFVTGGWATWTAFLFTFAGWLLAAIVVSGLGGVFKRD
jgi:hypothetical protein